MSAWGNLRLPQEWNAPQRVFRQSLLRDLRIVLLLGWAATWSIIAGFGMAYAQAPATPPYVSPPVQPLTVHVPLPPPVPAPAAPEPTTPMVTVPEGEPLPSERPPPRQPASDPVIQTDDLEVSGEAIGLISEPLVNVAGLISTANPPDTVADVGRDHVVQMVNVTFFQIFDKQGTALTGRVNFGALWPVGQICRGNAGDPIVVYDHLADRWLLSQFAFPNHMCVAISQTPDPTAGTWFLYTFNTLTFPDYPKFGVWPNGYYMSSYEPPNLGIYVFDRTNMLLGFAAGFFKSAIPALGAPGVRDTRILPADLDGPPPPGGRPPNFFVRTVDDQQDRANPIDRIEVYEALPDFVGLTFSFTLIDTLIPAPFQTMLCNRNGGGLRDCISQPTVATNTVDALSNRPMMQVKYRNFGAFETMVFNQTIDISGSIPFVLGFTPAEEVAGIRWYELRKDASSWTIYQQGTFAPQPRGATAEDQLVHRWMGSAAMDKDGNIAVGYSTTNSDPNVPVFPGIRYTGRRFDDPLDVLPQGERVILDGPNAQTQGLGARWGDYSALNIDPVDDCTFWYTTHVAGMGGFGPRPTQIASFRFDTCGSSAVLGVRPESIPVGGTITATWNAIPSPTSTDWIGLYVLGTSNTEYIDWIYVSCSKTPGSALPSGSCPFVVPATLEPGTYEARLLANDGFTLLATSNSFTVTVAEVSNSAQRTIFSTGGK